MPTGADGPTVTMPVTESIMIPLIAGSSLKRHWLVPSECPKADEATVRPDVEVKVVEPPVIPTAGLTTTVIAKMPVAFTLSVAVTVSYQVPIAVVESA